MKNSIYNSNRKGKIYQNNQNVEILTMINRQIFSATTAQQPRNEKKKTSAPHESMTQMEAAQRSFPIITVRKFLSTAIHIPIPMRTQPHIYRQSTSPFIYSFFLHFYRNYFFAFTNNEASVDTTEQLCIKDLLKSLLSNQLKGARTRNPCVTRQVVKPISYHVTYYMHHYSIHS